VQSHFCDLLLTKILHTKSGQISHGLRVLLLTWNEKAVDRIRRDCHRCRCRRRLFMMVCLGVAALLFVWRYYI